MNKTILIATTLLLGMAAMTILLGIASKNNHREDVLYPGECYSFVNGTKYDCTKNPSMIYIHENFETGETIQTDSEVPPASYHVVMGANTE